MLKLNLDPQPGLPLEVEIKTVRAYGHVLSRGNVDVHVNNGGGENESPPTQPSPAPPPPPPSAININNQQTQSEHTTTVRPYGDVLSRGNVNVYVNNGGGGNDSISNATS